MNVAALNSTLMPPEMRAEILSSMTPIAIARALLDAAGMDFDAILAEHLSSAYVVSRPTMFMMFRAVNIEGVHTWLISEAVAPDVRELIFALPFVLPQVAFYRRIDKRLRVYDLPRMIGKLLRKKPQAL